MKIGLGLAPGPKDCIVITFFFLGSTEDLREPVDMDFLNRSSINVKMDMTNQHIAFTLQMKFVEAFEGWSIHFFYVSSASFF